MALTNFAGAVAVITGGASGIGLATARALHVRGAHVVLADINQLGLQQAEEQIRQHNTEATGKILGIPTDVTNEQQVEALTPEAWLEQAPAAHAGSITLPLRFRYASCLP